MKTKHVSLDEVIAIHDNMISLYGGSHGIRDLGLIESAISRPKTTFGGADLYPDVFSKAAALFHSLMFNHAFIDGNKRTTISTTSRFLSLNGYELIAADREFIEFPLGVENKHLSLKEISKWLEKHSRKIA